VVKSRPVLGLNARLLPGGGRHHDRSCYVRFCFLMRKQKYTPFQCLTYSCAPPSDLDHDSGSGMLASRVSFKLRANAPISARSAMRAESFFMWRKANHNRPFSIAITIETAWPLLSSVGPPRRKDK
jgi:hypothetical protein